MSNDLRLDESGKILVISSNGFNMGSNSELILTFTKPSGEIIEKTKTAGEIYLGLVPVTVDDVSLNAEEYIEYPLETGLLDEYGDDWCMFLTYIDTDPEPDQKFKGSIVSFSVLKDCEC